MDNKKYIIDSKYLEDFHGYKGELVLIVKNNKFGHCTIESTLTGRWWYANIKNDLTEISELEEEIYNQIIATI